MQTLFTLEMVNGSYRENLGTLRAMVGSLFQEAAGRNEASRFRFRLFKGIDTPLRSQT